MSGKLNDPRFTPIRPLVDSLLNACAAAGLPVIIQIGMNNQNAIQACAIRGDDKLTPDMAIALASIHSAYGKVIEMATRLRDQDPGQITDSEVKIIDGKPTRPIKPCDA